MAGDYIRRAEAVKIAEKYGLANGSVLGRHTGLADCIARDISELPNADVAEVVRCKDCKYVNFTEHRDYLRCTKHCAFSFRPNDFCSYGERREE